MTRVGTIRVAIRRDDILRYQGTPPRTSQDVASEPRTMQQEWHSTRRNAPWVDEIFDDQLERSMMELDFLLRVSGFRDFKRSYDR